MKNIKKMTICFGILCQLLEKYTNIGTILQATV